MTKEKIMSLRERRKQLKHAIIDFEEIENFNKNIIDKYKRQFLEVEEELKSIRKGGIILR